MNNRLVLILSQSSPRGNGAGNNGGTMSFGSHCSASGGTGVGRQLDSLIVPDDDPWPDELDPFLDESFKACRGFRETYIRSVVRDWLTEWLGDSDTNATQAADLVEYLERYGLTITRLADDRPPMKGG